MCFLETHFEAGVQYSSLEPIFCLEKELKVDLWNRRKYYSASCSCHRQYSECCFLCGQELRDESLVSMHLIASIDASKFKVGCTSGGDLFLWRGQASWIEDMRDGDHIVSYFNSFSFFPTVHLGILSMLLQTPVCLPVLLISVLYPLWVLAPMSCQLAM